MRNKLLLIFLGLTLLGGCASGKKDEIAPGEHFHETMEEYYTCPMHPQVVSDKPGKCPICGMTLVKKKREAEPAHEQADTGMRDISLSPLKQVLANVGTTKIEKKRLVKTIRTIGTVAFDRELYAAEQEYLGAMKIARASARSGFSAVGRQGRETLEAARRKLEILGISAAEIARIEKTGAPDASLYLPQKGKGVWVNAEIFEYEREWVRPNQPVTLKLDAFPGETFHGTIVSVTPVVRFPSRSFRVRIYFPKPGKPLEPEMFGSATLQMDAGEKLAVPASAVIDTGDRRMVWVKKGENRFSPRHPKLGGRVGNDFVVLAGLEAGEEVVTEGGFLIDSEAELKSFGMGGHQH